MNTSQWSSFDPVSIPLEVRRSQLERGNIVPNPSFERGRTDAGAGSVSLEGWKVIGDGVEWIDEERHAIKIVRKSADEVDEIGSGVESDFLPVIPGNYLFTYDVKLKDIYPIRERYGSRLYDAIDVRLLFFDENKAPLDGAVEHPRYRIKIDNSRKNFTFANYWHIAEFGWANVLASTFTYPFSEGDVPDACRFVKLFLGLKGRGTMWIDNVDFRFSRWNFTALERVLPYADEQLGPADLINPTPKRVGNPRILQCVSPSGEPPMIIAPDAPETATAFAVDSLRRALETASGADIAVTSDPAAATGTDRLIFSIGENRLTDAHRRQLPFAEIAGHDQGYFITQPAETPNVVFLAGNSNRAHYYAVATAVQLLDRDGKTFHCYEVVDYPDFLGRAYNMGLFRDGADMEDSLADVRRMAAWKLNKTYSGYNDPGKDWLSPPSSYFAWLAAVGERCAQTGVVELAVQVNPYYHMDFMAKAESMSEETRRYWLHSRPSDVERSRSGFGGCAHSAPRV